MDDAKLTETDIADEDVFDVEEHGEQDAAQLASAKPHKAGVSFISALCLSLIAASAGGAIGWFGPKILDPDNAAPAEVISELSRDLAATRTQLSALSSDYAALDQRLEIAVQPVDIPNAVLQRLNTLEQGQSDALQSDNVALIEAQLTPISQRLDVLDSLLATEDSASVDSSALQQRFAALETEIAQMRVQLLQSGTSAVLTYSTPRTTYTQPADLKAADSQRPSNAGLDKYDLITNFPRAEMLNAVNAQTPAPQEQGFMRRLLDRHVDVRDVSQDEALQTINDAEGFLSQGDIATAIDMIETLSSQVKAPAKDWLIQAKKTL